MTFALNADVYTLSLCDTGEVTNISKEPIIEVKYDELPGSGDHHHDDLHLLPIKKKRILWEGYYLIVSASKKNGKRFHETQCHRPSGGRIFVKKSPK